MKQRPIFSRQDFVSSGSRGGSKKGPTKVRGNSDYYRALRAKREDPGQSLQEKLADLPLDGCPFTGEERVVTRVPTARDEAARADPTVRRRRRAAR